MQLLSIKLLLITSSRCMYRLSSGLGSFSLLLLPLYLGFLALLLVFSFLALQLCLLAFGFSDPLLLLEPFSVDLLSQLLLLLFIFERDALSRLTKMSTTCSMAWK